MSQISRLRNAEIANGNLINADDISVELNQLVAESNSQDTRVTSLESGAMTIAGVKQFSSAPKIDQIDERTSNAGVTIDGVLHKDGYIRTTPTTQPYTPVADGEFGYDSTNHAYKVMVNGTARSLIHEGNAGLSKGFFGGAPPRYNNAGSILVPAGCRVRNTSNTADIEASADLTVSLASSGENGLDTGSEANDTWYYVYLIKKSSDGTVAGLLSATNEASSGSVTLPTDYDLKRQLPLAVRNNSSGDLIPFVIHSGWPYRPFVQFRDFEDLQAGNPGTVITTYNVLNAGTATSFTAIGLSALVPPISKSAAINSYYLMGASQLGQAYLRATGSGLTHGYLINTGYNNQYLTSRAQNVVTDASQSVDYRTSNASCSISLWVYGFTVTEVN